LAPEPLRLAEVAPPSDVKEALPEFLSDDEAQADEVIEIEPTQACRRRIADRCGAANPLRRGNRQCDQVQ
jgi:hypothetical protein